MPTFSFAPVNKPTKAKTSSNDYNKYTIIIKDIEGIVCINLKGQYKIVIGKDEYPIASECFSCKGVSSIYEQTLTNDIVRVRHIRSEQDRDDRDRDMYLPFVAGCSVKGNIVKHNIANSVIFKIKKVFVDVNDPIAKSAIKFYRDNYKTIMNAINKDKPIVNVEADDIDK